MQHVANNMCNDVHQSLKHWPHFFAQLKNLEAFCRVKERRSKYVQSCLVGTPRLVWSSELHGASKSSSRALFTSSCQGYYSGDQADCARSNSSQSSETRGCRAAEAQYSHRGGDITLVGDFFRHGVTTRLHRRQSRIRDSESGSFPPSGRSPPPRRRALLPLLRMRIGDGDLNGRPN